MWRRGGLWWGMNLGLREEKNPAPRGAAHLFRGNLHRLRDKKQILVRVLKNNKKQSPLVSDDQGMIPACSPGR